MLHINTVYCTSNIIEIGQRFVETSHMKKVVVFGSQSIFVRVTLFINSWMEVITDRVHLWQARKFTYADVMVKDTGTGDGHVHDEIVKNYSTQPSSVSSSVCFGFNS